MNRKNFITSLIILLPVYLFSFLTGAKAYQYGGVVVTKELSMDKKVKKPDTGEWVDNLFASQYLFSPDQIVEFKVMVSNIGNSDIKVNLRDILPADYLYLYDSGNFNVNSDSNEINSQTELRAGETKEFALTAKTAPADKLPSASGYYCTYNTAQAWIEGREGEYQDMSQICIGVQAVTKGGIPIAEMPEAGPVDSLLVLLGSGISALAGLKLIKKK